MSFDEGARMVRRFVPIALLLVLVVASTASAQAVPVTGPDRAAILANVMLPITADPTGSRPAVEPVSSATLVTGSGGVTGQFTFGFKQGENNYVKVGLSAPAKDGRTEIVLGDDLPSGTKMTVTFSRLIGLGLTATSARLGQLRTAITERKTVNTSIQRVMVRESALALSRDGLTAEPGLLITGAINYGREKFTYRESDAGPDLAPQLRESQGFTGAVGLLFHQTGSASGAYIGMGFKASSGWKAATTRTRCTPVPESTVVDCLPVVIGEPTEVKKKSLSVEARQNIGKIFGWTPLLAYDFADAAEGKRWLFEVPLYLVTDKEDGTGSLTGGVALGWREGSGAYAAVFIGPKFSIPGIPGIQ
jgi:hypothetical protein